MGAAESLEAPDYEAEPHTPRFIAPATRDFEAAAGGAPADVFAASQGVHLLDRLQPLASPDYAGGDDMTDRTAPLPRWGDGLAPAPLSSAWAPLTSRTTPRYTPRDGQLSHRDYAAVGQVEEARAQTTAHRREEVDDARAALHGLGAGYWVVPQASVAGLPDQCSRAFRLLAACALVSGGCVALADTCSMPQDLDLALAPVPGPARSLVGGLVAPIAESLGLLLFGLLLAILEVDLSVESLLAVQTMVAKHGRLLMTTTGRGVLYTWLGSMMACTLAGEHARPTTVNDDMGQAYAIVASMYVVVVGFALLLTAKPQQRRLETCRAELFRRHGHMHFAGWRKLYQQCAAAPQAGLSLREFASFLRSAGLSGMPVATPRDLAYLGLLLSTPTRPPPDPAALGLDAGRSAWQGTLTERSHYSAYSLPTPRAAVGMEPRVHLRDVVAWVHARIPVY